MKKKLIAVMVIAACILSQPSTAGFDNYEAIGRQVEILLKGVGGDFIKQIRSLMDSWLKQMTTKVGVISELPEGVKEAWCPKDVPDPRSATGPVYGCVEFKQSDTTNDVIIKTAGAEINADVAKQAGAKTPAISTLTHVKLGEIGLAAENTAYKLGLLTAVEGFDARKALSFEEGMANAVNIGANVRPGDRSKDAGKKLAEYLTIPLIPPPGANSQGAAGSAGDPTGVKNQVLSSLVIGQQGVLNLPQNVREQGLGPAQADMFRGAGRRLYANTVFLAPGTKGAEEYRNALMSEYVLKPTDKDLSYKESGATDATVLRYMILQAQGTNRILIDNLRSNAEALRAQAITTANMQDMVSALENMAKREQAK